MADTVVHIGENSPEQVSYKLFHDVLRAEDKTLNHGEANSVDRAYILKLFYECRRAVSGIAPK